MPKVCPNCQSDELENDSSGMIRCNNCQEYFWESDLEEE